MAEVGIAAAAQYLGADHAVAPVRNRGDVLFGDGTEKAGPTSAGVEFPVRSKKGQSAANARVHSLPLIVEQRAAKGTLGALAAGDLELLWRELRGPILVGFEDLGNLNWAHEPPTAIEYLHFHVPLLIGAFYADGFAKNQPRLDVEPAKSPPLISDLDASIHSPEAREITLKTRKLLHTVQMANVQHLWEAGHVSLARKWLDEQVPDKTGGIDFREFEWYYWDRLLQTKTELLAGSEQAVGPMGFSQDGKFFASAGYHGLLRVWNWNTN